MIWLPGVLSQGGKKFTWARYEASYELVETLHKSNGTEYVFLGQAGSNRFITKASVNQSTGKIALSNILDPFEFTDGDDIPDIAYQKSDSSMTYFGNNYLNGYDSLDVAYKYVKKSATVGSDRIDYTYDIYKLTTQRVRGELVDTIDATDPSAYPENGVQGGYWYVKFSDTPITWERYALTEGEVQGNSVTQSFTSTTYLYRATSYNRNGKTFTATGTRTRASSLAVGNYLIQKNGAFVASTSMSGDTLFKITKKSGYTSVSITFDTYTIGDVQGGYIDSVTSYNPMAYPDNGVQDGYWYVRI